MIIKNNLINIKKSKLYYDKECLFFDENKLELVFLPYPDDNNLIRLLINYDECNCYNYVFEKNQK